MLYIRYSFSIKDPYGRYIELDRKEFHAWVNMGLPHLSPSESWGQDYPLIKWEQIAGLGEDVSAMALGEI